MKVVGNSVSEIKAKAFEKLTENAEKLNANAVVGIAVDVDITSSGYITVNITGTAVSILKR